MCFVWRQSSAKLHAYQNSHENSQDNPPGLLRTSEQANDVVTSLDHGDKANHQNENGHKKRVLKRILHFFLRQVVRMRHQL